MSDSRIFETDQFHSDLHSIVRGGHREVVAKLRESAYRSLQQRQPHGPHIRKLKGYTPPTWRYRVRSWRFFCGIDDANSVVAMVAAPPRGSAC